MSVWARSKSLFVFPLMLYSLKLNYFHEFRLSRLRKEIKMTKPIRSLLVSSLIILTLTSCSLGSSGAAQAEVVLATPTLAVTTIELSVQADAAALTSVGQLIKYTYAVKNTGASGVPGTLAVTGAVCPQINSVGNLDGAFDVGEMFVCTSEYTVTQADLDKGSITKITTAMVSGINSNAVTTTISKATPAVLGLSKTASPVTYDQVGQIITYTYVIMNNGTTTLGPAQFTVTDAGLSGPVSCGEPTSSLTPGATLTCTAAYTITQANMDAGSVSTAASAAGGGAATSQTASATVTKGAVVVPTTPSNSSLTAGSTIQHKVANGEWLWQIARCYGADPAATFKANSQLSDLAEISPNMIVTVPNIGSAGKIYGPPCVGTHTVQAGDTWASIALKYNADPTVLQVVNKNILSVGQVIKVPLNSAGALSVVK